MGDTISFCSVWKVWICISCRNITPGEKSPNLFNIAYLIPDCLFYELKTICHYFSICWCNHLLSFLIFSSFWSLPGRPLLDFSFNLVTFICLYICMWKREEFRELFFQVFKKCALQRGLYFVFYLPQTYQQYIVCIP